MKPNREPQAEACRRRTGEIRQRIPIRERFWPRVMLGFASGCWEWGASTNGKGYGQINVGGRGRPLLAHRVSWELMNGPIPDGLLVLHKCDNPPCVNPSHLFLGTVTDNMRDCARKGRAAKTGTGAVKLAAADVLEIRRLSERGVIQTVLARRFGVSQAHISKILLREVWTWLQ
jgi:hypothetical protein